MKISELMLRKNKLNLNSLDDHNRIYIEYSNNNTHKTLKNDKKLSISPLINNKRNSKIKQNSLYTATRYKNNAKPKIYKSVFSENEAETLLIYKTETHIPYEDNNKNNKNDRNSISNLNNKISVNRNKKLNDKSSLFYKTTYGGFGNTKSQQKLSRNFINLRLPINSDNYIKQYKENINNIKKRKDNISNIGKIGGVNNINNFNTININKYNYNNNNNNEDIFEYRMNPISYRSTNSERECVYDYENNFVKKSRNYYYHNYIEDSDDNNNSVEDFYIKNSNDYNYNDYSNDKYCNKNDNDNLIDKYLKFKRSKQINIDTLYRDKNNNYNSLTKRSITERDNIHSINTINNALSGRKYCYHKKNAIGYLSSNKSNNKYKNRNKNSSDNIRKLLLNKRNNNNNSNINTINIGSVHCRNKSIQSDNRYYISSPLKYSYLFKRLRAIFKILELLYKRKYFQNIKKYVKNKEKNEEPTLILSEIVNVSVNNTDFDIEEFKVYKELCGKNINNEKFDKINNNINKCKVNNTKINRSIGLIKFIAALTFYEKSKNFSLLMKNLKVNKISKIMYKYIIKNFLKKLKIFKVKTNKLNKIYVSKNLKRAIMVRRNSINSKDYFSQNIKNERKYINDDNIEYNIKPNKNMLYNNIRLYSGYSSLSNFYDKNKGKYLKFFNIINRIIVKYNFMKLLKYLKKNKKF